MPTIVAIMKSPAAAPAWKIFFLKDPVFLYPDSNFFNISAVIRLRNASFANQSIKKDPVLSPDSTFDVSLGSPDSNIFI